MTRPSEAHRTETVTCRRGLGGASLLAGNPDRVAATEEVKLHPTGARQRGGRQQTGRQRLAASATCAG